MSAGAGSTPIGCTRGVIAPLFTPLRADRSIDEGAIRGLTDYLARTRAVSAVFARSGAGQIYTFTVEETKLFGARVLDALGGHMPMMLGCPGEWLERGKGARPEPGRYVAQGVDLTQYAAKIGAEAAVHPLPVALVPEKDEPASELVFRYYRTVNDASSIPILVYQPPGTPPEYCLSPELVERLLTLPRVAGAKISSQKDSVMQPLLSAARGTRFGVICGNECYWLRGLQQGATGVVGLGTMAFPELHCAVLRRFCAGDLTGAREASDDLLRAVAVIDPLNPKVACKQYLQRKGVRLDLYTRVDPDLYYDGPSVPYQADVIDRVQAVFDPLRAKYRVR